MKGSGTKRKWTAEETALVRKHYPRLGADRMAAILDGRSVASIRVHANNIGVKVLTRAKGYRPRECDLPAVVVPRMDADESAECREFAAWRGPVNHESPLAWRVRA